MFSINELKDILKPYFKIDNRRLNCLVQILIALITARTVNLVEIAQCMISGSFFEARYKRVRRFFKEFKGFDFRILAKFIAKYFLPSETKWQLSMDRTNWKWGKTNINILVLSIIYGSVSIPIIWKFLDKEGNSNLTERIEIMQEFISIFGTDRISDLFADREFVGKEWFKWLQEQMIPFTIRIKKNFLVDSIVGNSIPVFKLFYNVKFGKTKTLRKIRSIYGIAVWLSATRSMDRDLVVVATTYEPSYALTRYKKRWAIETLFGFLKSKGFNFEDTHLTHKDRLHNLFSILTIAFCFAYKLGQILAKEMPVKLKKHGRLSKSILRVGLDSLREIFIQIKRKFNNLLELYLPKATKNRVIDLIFSEL